MCMTTQHITMEKLLQAEVSWWLMSLCFCAPSCSFTLSTLRLKLSVDKRSIQFHFDFCSRNNFNHRFSLNSPLRSQPEKAREELFLSTAAQPPSRAG